MTYEPFDPEVLPLTMVQLPPSVTRRSTSLDRGPVDVKTTTTPDRQDWRAPQPRDRALHSWWKLWCGLDQTVNPRLTRIVHNKPSRPTTTTVAAAVTAASAASTAAAASVAPMYSTSMPLRSASPRRRSVASSAPTSPDSPHEEGVDEARHLCAQEGYPRQNILYALEQCAHERDNDGDGAEVSDVTHRDPATPRLCDGTAGRSLAAPPRPDDEPNDSDHDSAGDDSVRDHNSAEDCGARNHNSSRHRRHDGGGDIRSPRRGDAAAEGPATAPPSIVDVIGFVSRALAIPGLDMALLEQARGLHRSRRRPATMMLPPFEDSGDDDGDGGPATAASSARRLSPSAAPSSSRNACDGCELMRVAARFVRTCRANAVVVASAAEAGGGGGSDGGGGGDLRSVRAGEAAAAAARASSSACPPPILRGLQELGAWLDGEVGFGACA